MIDPVLITVIAGSISVVTNVVFLNIRKMRCVNFKNICCECDRELMTTDELRMEASAHSITTLSKN
jgi:hypothetical protein